MEEFEVATSGGFWVAIGGEGAARDLGCNAFLLRPPERTFPFSSVGEDFATADFLESFAMPLSLTLPFMDLYGNVCKARTRAYLALKKPFLKIVSALWG